MATFRPISVNMWRDKTFKNLDTSEKLFWAYLLTNPFTKQCGIYNSPAEEMSLYSGLSVQVVKLLLERFEKVYNLIRYDYDTNEICILNWYKHHTNDSPNVLKCIESEIGEVESYELVKAMQENCRIQKVKVILLNRQKSLKLKTGDTGGVQEPCSEGEPSQNAEQQQVPKQLASKKDKEKEKEEKEEREDAPAQEFLNKVLTPKQMLNVITPIISKTYTHRSRAQEIGSDYKLDAKEVKRLMYEVLRDYEDREETYRLIPPNSDLKWQAWFSKFFSRLDKFADQRRKTTPEPASATTYTRSENRV